MKRIQCFMLEITGECARYLRRYERRDYSKDEPPSCTQSGMGIHEAMTRIENDDLVPHAVHKGCFTPKLGQHCDRADPRWPTHCVCGYEFKPEDEWQLFYNNLYRRVDTGEIMTLRDAPVGAMWDATWSPASRRGPDGRSLHVKTPDGEWCIDARARNCTMPDDNVHKCWVRHGEPPLITVDKNGHTCAAGAGSIAMPRYHGFLRQGFLEEC